MLRLCRPRKRELQRPRRIVERRSGPPKIARRKAVRPRIIPRRIGPRRIIRLRITQRRAAQEQPIDQRQRALRSRRTRITRKTSLGRLRPAPLHRVRMRHAPRKARRTPRTLVRPANQKLQANQKSLQRRRTRQGRARRRRARLARNQNLGRTRQRRVRSQALLRNRQLLGSLQRHPSRRPLRSMKALPSRVLRARARPRRARNLRPRQRRQSKVSRRSVKLLLRKKSPREGELIRESIPGQRLLRWPFFWKALCVWEGCPRLSG